MFAVNYIQLERIEDAVRVVDGIRPVIISDFERTYTSFVRSEEEFQELNNEFEEARRQGDINTQRELRGRINSTYERRQSYGDQLMQVRQYLSIASYTLFKSNNMEGANEIIDLVNTSFEGTPFPTLPTTVEESEIEMRRYGLTN